MKNITSYFDAIDRNMCLKEKYIILKSENKYTKEDVLKELENIGIHFDDNHDYSNDELLDIFDKITEEFPYEYNDDFAGMPKRKGYMFEDLIDIFTCDILEK